MTTDKDEDISRRMKPDARVEDVLLLIMGALRRRLPLMLQRGFYGQLSAVVQFQDGVPQGLKITDEEMTKIAANKPVGK